MKNNDRINNVANYPQAGKTVYFYETKEGGGRGLVVACAQVDNIDVIRCFSDDFIRGYLEQGAITREELIKYNHGTVNILYAYELSNAEELVTPQSFRTFGYSPDRIIMAIQPKQLKKILAGEKTIEFRHTMPSKWR